METNLDHFLPHQGRMKLVDTLVALDREQKTGDVLVHLKADAPYFVKQVFQSHWLIEIMAQAGAVLSHALRREGSEGGKVPGFLIAIRSFSRDDRRPLEPGDVLRVRAHFAVEMESVGQCLGTVLAEDGKMIAHGEMTFLSGAGREF